MSLKNKYEISTEFQSLFEFKSEEAELKHDAYILMFKFLSEVDRLTEGTLQQKELAKALATSTSFISQLYSGNKLANLITLAKLQKSYDITFEVKAHSNSSLGNEVQPVFSSGYSQYPKIFEGYENTLTVVASNTTIPPYIKTA